MANRGNIVEPLVSGASLSGAVKTATFTTDGFSFNKPGTRLHLWAEYTAVSGSTPVCTITPEFTMDGTTYAALTDGANSTTAATGAGVTAAGVDSEWWEVGCPFADDTSNYKVRLVFTLSGTTPSFTIDKVMVSLS